MELNIHRRKSKVLRVNKANTNPIPLRGELIKDVDSFTYLGNIVSKTGGTDEDVKARIQKAGNETSDFKLSYDSSVLM